MSRAGIEGSVLTEELATFEAHKAELLGQHAGRFALVHGSDVLGAYDTQRDAIQIGYKSLGNVPFLTKRVEAVETPVTFTRDVLAIPQVPGE